MDISTHNKGEEAEGPGKEGKWKRRRRKRRRRRTHCCSNCTHVKQTKAYDFIGRAFSLWGWRPRVDDRRFFSCWNKTPRDWSWKFYYHPTPPPLSLAHPHTHTHTEALWGIGRKSVKGDMMNTEPEWDRFAADGHILVIILKIITKIIQQKVT